MSKPFTRVRHCLAGALLWCAGLAHAQVCSPPPQSTGPCPPPGYGLRISLPVAERTPVLPSKIDANGGCTVCHLCGGVASICDLLPPGPGGPGGGGGGVGGGGGGGGTQAQNLRVGGSDPVALGLGREIWLAQPGDDHRTGLLALQLRVHTPLQIPAGARVQVLELDWIDDRNEVGTIRVLLLRDPAIAGGWRAEVESAQLRAAAPMPVPVSAVPGTLELPLTLTWQHQLRRSTLTVKLAGALVQVPLPTGGQPAALRTGLLALEGVRSGGWRVATGVDRFERDGQSVRH